MLLSWLSSQDKIFRMPFELFVNGTLMRGLKLHPNMGDSEFLGEFRTAPHYRVHTIGDVHPGMYRLNDDEEGGASIWGELYMVPDEVWAAIEAGEPPNLYRGTIELEDGRSVYGILYPRELAEGYYPEITEFGGWRAYWASKTE
jgi:gamma-glutamylcyclotransferase (GGCT)/AIG2-like uncharacterized protein YtfP